jgi:hypothetical protein
MSEAQTNTALEKFSDEMAYEFINGASNHELKLLTTAVVLANPDFTYTATSLHRTMLERQGEEPVWKFQQSTPKQYCDQSLEPIGAVITNTVIGERGRQVNGYRASPDHRQSKLALTGFLMGWSLRYPDLSLQQVYGPTASNSNVRSPQVRHQIYLALLTGDNGKDISNLYKSLEGAGYKYRISINAQLDAMKDYGILTVASHKTDFDPLLRIDNAEYTHLSRHLNQTLPETQALYAAMQLLGSGQNVSVNELISAAKRIDTRIDEVTLRRKLINAVTVKGYPGLTVVEKGKVPEGQSTIVELSDEDYDVISELCVGIENIKDGYNIDENVALAKTIISNPEQFAALVTKARKFSPARAGHESGREVLEDQLGNIVKGLGDTTVAAARDELYQRHGRRLSARVVREILIDLADNGRVTSESYYKNPHSKVASRIFKPAA